MNKMESGYQFSDDEQSKTAEKMDHYKALVTTAKLNKGDIQW